MLIMTECVLNNSWFWWWIFTKKIDIPWEVCDPLFMIWSSFILKWKCEFDINDIYLIVFKKYMFLIVNS